MKNLNIDISVQPVSWIEPGESAANKSLILLNQSLNNYDVHRNDPNKNALSNLSP